MEEDSRVSPNFTPTIDAENWKQAELTAQEILRCIRPTVASQEKRRSIVKYLIELLQKSCGVKLFEFGSSPLKTYLPDGDIDLTFVGSPDKEDTLFREVKNVLEAEELKKDAGYRIMNVRSTSAKVKVIKFSIEEIRIDLSFNQIGGLCALCFLERVDHIAGKYHLFKQSILLVKCWCYYESRVLGARYGLLSTYALEILVMYILQFFHSSLNCPLAVLLQFLEYYSTFDWQNYCISLHGLLPLSSLSDLVGAPLVLPDGDVLLGKGVLGKLLSTFSNDDRNSGERIPNVFSQKDLNIVDPLKSNNNLGISVSRSSFFRVRSAFVYGAHHLRAILESPKEQINKELKSFFAGTLERHGNCSDPGSEGKLALPSSSLLEDLTGRCNLHMKFLKTAWKSVENGSRTSEFQEIGPPPTTSDEKDKQETIQQTKVSCCSNNKINHHFQNLTYKHRRGSWYTNRRGWAHNQSTTIMSRISNGRSLEPFWQKKSNLGARQTHESFFEEVGETPQELCISVNSNGASTSSAFRLSSNAKEFVSRRRARLMHSSFGNQGSALHGHIDRVPQPNSDHLRALSPDYGLNNDKDFPPLCG